MKRIIGIAVVLLVCSLNACGFAGEESASIEVVASGVGRDSDSALKNAFKAAVQQALGSIVDSKVMVENDEVVSDKILSHSGGYVTEYEMLGDPKTEDDLVTVRIKAQVERRQLMASAASEGLILQEDTSEPFDIKAKVYTTAQDNRSAREMFTEQIKDYPENFVTLKYAGSKPGEKEGEFWVDVEVSIDHAEITAFNKDFIALLDRVAEAPAVDIRYKMEKVNYHNGDRGVEMERSGKEGFSLEDAYTISVFSRVNGERTLGSWKRYVVSKELAGIFSVGTDRSKLFMRIALLDDSGSVIRENTFTFPRPYSIYHRTTVLYDMLQKRTDLYPVIPGDIRDVLHYKFDDLFPDEIEEISQVKVTMEKR